MKDQNTPNEILKMIIFVFLISGMIIGCQSDQEQIAPSEVGVEKSKAEPNMFPLKYEPGTMIDFEGTLNYWTYAVKLKEELQNVTFECLATLEILEHNEVNLHITEYAIGEDRYYILEGKLTKGGKLKVHHPSPLFVTPEGIEVNMTDVIQGHTGCELYGPGINDGVLVFNGSFDGERIVAPATFMSFCDVEWPPNNLFETPVDGPVKWKWEFNFEML